MNCELTLCSSFSIILSLISTMFATSIPDRIKLFDYTIYGFLDLVVWDFHSAGPLFSFDFFGLTWSPRGSGNIGWQTQLKLGEGQLKRRLPEIAKH